MNHETGMSPVKELSSVAEALSSLDRAISENASVVEMLEGKIRVALAQESPAEASGNEKAVRSYSSELASALFELAARVRTTNYRVINIKDRVEL